MTPRHRILAPDLPKVRLCLGVAGHRAMHRSYADNLAGIEAVFAQVLDIIQSATDKELGDGGAQRTRVHSLLADGADQLSESLFQMAVAAVALFPVFQVAAWAGAMDEHNFKSMTKVFTFLGVAFPTSGGAIAGVRYFGDFERFAAISEVTSQKLDAVHERIRLLLRTPDGKLDYASVANLAHAADDIVVAEIENWQAVFGGKQFTVPV